MKLLFSLTIIGFLYNGFAQEYAVVSNGSVKKLTKSQIKALYLKKLSTINDQKIIPVNLSFNHKTRMLFQKEILQSSQERMKSYWTKQHYLGIRPPLTMKSQASALVFTKNFDGAITYTLLEDVESHMNILYKWEDEGE